MSVDVTSPKVLRVLTCGPCIEGLPEKQCKYCGNVPDTERGACIWALKVFELPQILGSHVGSDPYTLNFSWRGLVECLAVHHLQPIEVPGGLGVLPELRQEARGIAVTAECAMLRVYCHF